MKKYINQYSTYKPKSMEFSSVFYEWHYIVNKVQFKRGK